MLAKLYQHMESILQSLWTFGHSSFGNCDQKYDRKLYVYINQYCKPVYQGYRGFVQFKYS